MKMETAVKGLALTALIGGVARIGMAPSGAIWGTDSIQELIFGLIACLLMGIGIFGVFLRGADKLGIVGFLSVILISLSSTLTAALVWSSMLGIAGEDHNYIPNMQSVNSLIMLIGMIGFCVQSIRSRIYPIWTAVLFLLFPILSFIPVAANWAAVAWGISYIGFGYYAFANKTARNPAYFSQS
ncbi:hypothetical protein ACF3MZ_10365 [Paenibacillaceae bacterium WGS1546]|uniref:hypothetical protein n=1 Tax=Cohnella sp. WGS1546 TaxID=3366810 RepID=UPI00372D77A8